MLKLYKMSQRGTSCANLYAAAVQHDKSNVIASEPGRARQSRAAFTLAEVLITLVIIGVIAALTIPNLLRKQNDHADVQKVKKVYANLANAYQLAIRDLGTIPEGGWTQNQGGTSSSEKPAADDVMQKLLPYFKNSEMCPTTYGGFAKCYTHKLYQFDNTEIAKQHYVVYPFARLSDGTVIYLALWDNNCKFSNIYCGFIQFDINGKRGPNRHGYDIFIAYMLQDRLVPAGNGMNGLPQTFSWAHYCRNLYPTSYGKNGTGCTAWVLYKGNMDYKYKDIEW